MSKFKSFTHVALQPGWYESNHQNTEYDALLEWVTDMGVDKLEFEGSLWDCISWNSSGKINFMDEIVASGHYFQVIARPRKPAHTSERYRQRITVRI